MLIFRIPGWFFVFGQGRPDYSCALKTNDDDDGRGVRGHLGAGHVLRLDAVVRVLWLSFRLSFRLSFPFLSFHFVRFRGRVACCARCFPSLGLSASLGTLILPALQLPQLNLNLNHNGRRKTILGAGESGLITLTRRPGRRE